MNQIIIITTWIPSKDSNLAFLLHDCSHLVYWKKIVEMFEYHLRVFRFVTLHVIRDFWRRDKIYWTTSND